MTRIVSDENGELRSSSDEDDDDNEVDEQLSDEEISALSDEPVPTTRASKRTLDSAEQEIMALYDGIKSSKKLKASQESEDEDELEQDAAAMFGDTDSENDEPVFLEGKAGEDEEDEDETEELPKTRVLEEAKQADEAENEEYDDDGRRAINYQIAKNKGLTPKRKKEYRNPRVRHRIKYRKANIRRKGQVRAMRNESAHYGGEMSGINKQVVKSVKLK